MIDTHSDYSHYGITKNKCYRKGWYNPGLSYFGSIPQNAIQDHMVILYLILGKTAEVLSIGATALLPITHENFSFSTSLLTLVSFTWFSL